MNYRKNPFTLLIHIALAIIVAGALVTHFRGIQGKVTLVEGEEPVTQFEKSSGPGDGRFPFGVRLLRAETLYYPGTTTPMDFRSVIEVGGRQLTVAMNSVASLDGWRFYQTGMGDATSTLSVSHDPVGIAVTYSGYALLALAMTGFLFQRRSVWRSWLSRRSATVALIALLPLTGFATRSLPAMQLPVARDFGKIHVYWNDRVCPLQTMAMDVCSELYGSTSYQGLTPEQVLGGWLFNFDEWEADYNAMRREPATEKERKREEKRRALIRWIGLGEAFRIYPYRAATGNMEWLSLTGRRPSKMSLDQWKFMVTSMRDISVHLSRGRNIEADEGIKALIEGQRLYAGEDMLPSGFRFKAELFYNRYVRLFPAAGLMMVAGVVILLWGHRWQRRRAVIMAVAVTAWVFLGGVLTLRGVIGGHIPLGNGTETMLFMGFAAVTAALWVRDSLIGGSLLLVGAMAVLVAAMSSRTPQIASLMPVLASSLLTIHVMLVMCAYVGCLLMAILSAIALAGKPAEMARLSIYCRILLVPSVFLLTAGIFVGAVWANQSWGRYWGWDPKETCALVTMLVYALPIHSKSLRWFRSDRNLTLYLLFAILSVAFTYFGANYLLPGLHSYA